MNLISAFIHRRFAHIRHRWLGELSLALLLPIGIYITLGFGLSSTAPDIEDVPKLAWLIPGIVLMIAFSGGLFAIFHDIFQNRGSGQFYGSVYVSPSTPSATVMSLTLSVAPEGAVRSILAMVILQFVLGHLYPVGGQISMVFLILFAIFIGTSAGLTLGIVAKDAITSQLTVLLLLIGLGFGSAWFVPLDVFPESIQPLLSVLPTSVLGELSRGFLIGTPHSMVLLIIPLGTLVVWTVINIFLFTRISTE
ncbi:MAG: ABC transporter permease [Candidatus Neomarinimicrobiota bacterium]|nr:ABC transporter permease [Candidatus Neomarinimicrobiota bacterium]